MVIRMKEQSVVTALRYLLDQKGMTVAAVAEATGIKPSTLYSALNKKSNQADLGMLKKLADYFEVGIEIFCGVEEYKDQLRLTDEERELIESSRQLNQTGHNRLYEYMKELRVMYGKK